MGVFLSVVVFLFFPWSARGEGERPVTVRLIEVRGNRRIDASAVLSKIRTKEGDDFSVEGLREDLESVHKMGFFEDVQIETEAFEGGVKVIFLVREKPFLKEILFTGNEKISQEKLTEKVGLKIQHFLDQAQIKEASTKIGLLYEEEGYYMTRVVPVIKKVPPDHALLTFVIEEGERARLQKILFEGNRAFTERQLKKQLVTKEYFYLTSWFTGTGIYKKEEMEREGERIRDLYFNQGYLQAQIGVPQVQMSPDRRGLSVIFPLVEGEQFRVGRVSLQGNTVFTDEELFAQRKVREGEVFSRGLLREDIMRITDLYGERGYTFARITPHLSFTPVSRSVAVVLEVAEGERVRVHQINIFGNEKTRDKVIRREVRVNEQDIIDTKSLRRSIQRINNLNFFESVEVTPRPVGQEQVDLDVRIKEKSTGMFTIGGGFSSVDQFVALTEITQGNLFGRGQLLRLKANIGRRRTTYSFTFREPYLFDREVSGTTDLFNQQRNFQSTLGFKEERVGGDLVLGRRFGEYIHTSLSYGWERLNIFDVDTGSIPIGDSILCNADPTCTRIREQVGTSTTSAVGFSIVRDTRDFFFDPREGSRHSLSLSLAGTVLGGDNEFYKLVTDSSKFFPLWGRTVFSLHGRIGYSQGIGGKKLPLSERFFVGGGSTVRGFDFGGAGPKSDGIFLGGNKEAIFNAEYLIPLVPEAGVKGVLFFDAGRAFDDHEGLFSRPLRYSTGLGIRWTSPIGPLRLEWGFILDKKSDDREKSFDFSIGSLF